jgi:putative inorganic carbon (HCO3(-)) transporter
MVKHTLIFLDRLHWLWLVLAAPFLLFPSPKGSLVMLVIPALFLLRWMALMVNRQEKVCQSDAKTYQRSTIIPITPLNGALLLLSVMILVSLWATFDINLSLPKISGVLLGIGVFFAIAREGTRSRGWMISLLAFFGLGLATAILGVFGISWFPLNKIAIFSPIIARLPRLLSGIQGAETGFHPNEVAGALIWVLPVVIAVCVILLLRRPKGWEFRTSKKGWQKILDFTLTLICLGATIFIAAVFLLCQSRSGYIGLAFTIIVLIPIALPLKWRLYSLVALLVLAIIIGILLASNWEAVRTWIMGSNLDAAPALSLNTLSGRVEVWSRAIYGIQDFPFTGMGMNAFRKVMPVLYPLFNISPDIDLGHAHNEFLQAALDLGIPGMIAFLALYIGSFWMLADIWKATRVSLSDGDDQSLITRFLTLGLAGSLVAHFIFGLTDAVALGAKPGILFWMLLGLVTALHRQKQENLVINDGSVSSPSDKNEFRI